MKTMMELPKATILQLLPKTENTEIGKDEVEKAPGAAHVNKPLPKLPDQYAQIKSPDEV